MPLPEGDDLFWVVDFFEFLFLLKNLGVVEEREQSFGPLSLSSS